MNDIRIDKIDKRESIRLTIHSDSVLLDSEETSIFFFFTNISEANKCLDSEETIKHAVHISKRRSIGVIGLSLRYDTYSRTTLIYIFCMRANRKINHALICNAIRYGCHVNAPRSS